MYEKSFLEIKKLFLRKYEIGMYWHIKCSRIREQIN